MKINLRKPETEIRTTVEFSEEQLIEALGLYIEKHGYVLTKNIIKKCVYLFDNHSHKRTITLVLYTQSKIKPEIIKAIEKNANSKTD